MKPLFAILLTATVVLAEPVETGITNRGASL